MLHYPKLLRDLAQRKGYTQELNKIKQVKGLLQPYLDAIFAMRQLLKRIIEYNQNLYNISIDQE